MVMRQTSNKNEREIESCINCIKGLYKSNWFQIDKILIYFYTLLTIVVM